MFTYISLENEDLKDLNSILSTGCFSSSFTNSRMKAFLWIFFICFFTFSFLMIEQLFSRNLNFSQFSFIYLSHQWFFLRWIFWNFFVLSFWHLNYIFKGNYCLYLLVLENLNITSKILYSSFDLMNREE